MNSIAQTHDHAGPGPDGPRMRFDPTINAGHVLMFVGLLCTGIGSIVYTSVQTAKQEVRIAALETQFAEYRADMRALTGALGDIREDVAAIAARQSQPR